MDRGGSFCAARCHIVWLIGISGKNNDKSSLGGGLPDPRSDVSYYQGEIDWGILAEENIDFAFIKATEGSSHIDTKFKENWEQSGKTRLKRGAYHFFSFESTGEAQAEHFISVVPKEEGMLSPVVDIEFYGDRFYNKPDVEETRKQLQSLLDRLEEYYGVKPLIYATESSYSTYIRGAFDEYPLWIRNIYFSPNMGMPGKWTFWQYDSDAKLQGYSGEEEHIDLNVFYGSEKEWTDFLEDHSISVRCDTTLIQNR